ncbi:MAG: phospho-N-acetylmuramoyl-pentapeptide-transferase [Tissierellia bacterium]|nr:phospho-N-acetylmuramoyl-pentapeptide-transferase [Tissierellia bacterium]
MDIKQMAVVLLLSTILSTVLGRFTIPILKGFKIGQNIRDDGPKSHLSKQGTPTMGGVIILMTLVLGMIAGLKFNLPILIVLLTTFGFGAVGFVDDYMKLIMKRSLGLTAMQKIVAQVLISVLVMLLYRYAAPESFSLLRIPFTKEYLDIGILAYPLYTVMLIGAVNAVNLTDGLDGLLSSVSIPVLAVLLLIVRAVTPELEHFVLVMMGGILGFLFYNSNKAAIFMGDTGSMAIGGAVAGLSMITQTTLYLPILGLIYVVEALSVIIQVISYKTRNKKRVFLMSPIHHHYELKGYNEQKIVTAFTLVSTCVALLTILAYF